MCCLTVSSAVAPLCPFLHCSSKPVHEGYKQGSSMSSLNSCNSFPAPVGADQYSAQPAQLAELPTARNGAPVFRPAPASHAPARAGLSAPGPQQALRVCLAKVRPPGGQPAGRLWRRDPKPGPKSPERGGAPTTHQALEEAPEGLPPLLGSLLGLVPVRQRVRLRGGRLHARGRLFGFLLVALLLVGLRGCLLALVRGDKRQDVEVRKLDSMKE